MPTTYKDLRGHKFAFTPHVDYKMVMVLVNSKMLGHYSIERFGESPITPKGRLTAKAITTFENYVFKENK